VSLMLLPGTWQFTPRLSA